ncbi:MAG: hypothetical protein AAGA03_01165 [Planctomycetota bacterium]
MLAATLFHWSAADAWGQEVGLGQAVATPEVTATDQLSVTPQQARRAVQWLADFAVRRLPASHQGDKDWGKTKRIWAGVDIRRDGWKLRTHRRWREVRHGRWIRYRIDLPHRGASSPPPVAVQIRSVDAVQGGWRIAASIVADAPFDVRLERWNLGTKWVSVNVTGQSRAKLDTQLLVQFRMDYDDLFPAMIVSPEVQAAHLTLERFEVERISKLGGDVAEGIGEVIQEVIKEAWLKKQNDRLVGKLNREISKHQQDLRLSPAKLLESVTDR